MPYECPCGWDDIDDEHECISKDAWFEEPKMNREIKFRAWDSKIKTFYNPVISDGESQSFDYGDMYPNYDPISQYTGLKDKNGKEIYEGDIIRWNDKNYEVFYAENCPGYYLNNNGFSERLFDVRMKWMEVVGNIYENKGLLEGV